MNKLTIVLTLVLIAMPLQAQDITNKLGGNTANETYDVTDSADNVLFRVQGDGKVGIGTSAPDELLHIDGNMRLDGTFEDKDGEAGTSGQILSSTVTGTDWISTSGSLTYSIGDFAQGGIVFWVDETGQHGLVCAKSDQDGGSGIRWYAGTYGNTQAKGDGPYAGEANTAIIIAAQVAIGDDGSTYAARICNELQITEGGKTYGDWYLPSKEELNLMYQNKATIDATATVNGGSAFATPGYWSSTEYSNSHAWRQFFDSGYQYYGGKNFALGRVRAVRAF